MVDGQSFETEKYAFLNYLTSGNRLLNTYYHSYLFGTRTRTLAVLPFDLSFLLGLVHT
jgi:hypothetical protein